MDNIMVAKRFGNLLQSIENVAPSAPITITLDARSWDFEARNIKNVLMEATFGISALRKEIKTLQEQIAETDPPENEMDTVLKRALHHLECYAALYHSSPVDEVVTEVRQLITEGKWDQVKGETLWAEPRKWEYRWLHNDDDDLDEVGADGWEAVLISGPLILFKRQK